MTSSSRQILVTGASSGIGLACARLFLQRGDRVVAQYRSQRAPVTRLLEEFGTERVVTVCADLSEEQGCCEAAGVAERLDVVVHSAGIWTPGAIDSLTAEVLEETFRINTFSAYYLAREACRAMDRGSFIVIGSTAGERGEPEHSHYAGSKAALWGLVQSLAQELAPAIRVNLVSPGWVRTPMAQPSLSEGGREGRITAGVPLGRIAEPEDVAEVVYFLADEQRARHLTGVDLPVSGGALLPMPRG